MARGGLSNKSVSLIEDGARSLTAGAHQFLLHGAHDLRVDADALLQDDAQPTSEVDQDECLHQMGSNQDKKADPEEGGNVFPSIAKTVANGPGEAGLSNHIGSGRVFHIGGIAIFTISSMITISSESSRKRSRWPKC